MVVNTGGLSSLINVISCSHEFPPTPAIIALGFIAAMSPMLASAIIHSQVLIQFLNRFDFTKWMRYDNIIYRL